MKVLITGGTDFIGSNLAKRLVDLEYEVWATGNLSQRHKLPKEVKFLPHGIMGIDWSRLKNELGGDTLDVTFHYAEDIDSTSDDKEMEFLNVASALKVFEKTIDLGCRKVVFASSAEVYGHAPIPYLENGICQPLNSYANSKLFLERAVNIMSRNIPDVTFIGLRLANVYGPGEDYKDSFASDVFKMSKQIRYRPPLVYGKGHYKRDYIFIDDVVEANLLAMASSKNEIYNCGTGDSISHNDLFDILKNVLNIKSWSSPNYINHPDIGDPKRLPVENIQCDVNKIKDELGFEAKYNIQDGVNEYYARNGIK